MQPRLRVERLHRAGGAADEQRAAHHRRRRESGHVAGESERPLQLEPRQVGGAQPGALAVESARCPARDSSRPSGAVAPARIARAGLAHRARRQRRFVGALAEKGRQGLPLRALERVGHAHHRAEVQRAQDAGRRQSSTSASRAGCAGRLVVTRRAVLRVELLASPACDALGSVTGPSAAAIGSRPVLATTGAASADARNANQRARRDRRSASRPRRRPRTHSRAAPPTAAGPRSRCLAPPAARSSAGSRSRPRPARPPRRPARGRCCRLLPAIWSAIPSR